MSEKRFIHQVDPVAVEHWRKVREGLIQAAGHQFADDSAEVIRGRAEGLLCGGLNMMRRANDLLAVSNAMLRGEAA